MLAYILALVVGFSSFSLYMAAFFFPEVHRKYDLVWSGVGMFYALVLWVCAGRITGGVLLGQVASVSLLGWFGWQTLKLRQEQTPIAQQTQIPGGLTLGEWAQDRVSYLRNNFRQRKLGQDLDALLTRGSDFLDATKGWVDALLSTTFKPNYPSPNYPSEWKSPQPSSPASSATQQAVSAESPSVTPGEPLRENDASILTEDITPTADLEPKISSPIQQRDRSPQGSPIAQFTESLANLKQRIQQRFGRSAQSRQEGEATLTPSGIYPANLPTRQPEVRFERTSVEAKMVVESDAVSGSSRDEELDVEWDDLEEESYPELDTVEEDISNLPVPNPFHPLQNGSKPSRPTNPFEASDSSSPNQPGENSPVKDSPVEDSEIGR